MSHLLEAPTAVVVVGGGAGSWEESALTGGAATAVVHRSSVDGAVATLEERDDVGCVVLTGERGERAADDCRRIRAADRYAPIVVLTEGGAGILDALADVEHCRLLPRSVSSTRLREVVDAALADYEERRGRAADSSILETLLAESEIPIYAKDDRARIVRMADVQYSPDPEAIYQLRLPRPQDAAAGGQRLPPARPGHGRRGGFPEGRGRPGAHGGDHRRPQRTGQAEGRGRDDRRRRGIPVRS